MTYWYSLGILLSVILGFTFAVGGLLDDISSNVTKGNVLHSWWVVPVIICGIVFFICLLAINMVH